MIRHVVLLRFKNETSPSRRTELERDFAGLGSLIDGIEHLEWGVNVSGEGLEKGFTHCFTLSFAGLAERDAYLPHPLHQQFVGRLQPWVEDVLVLDYAPAAARAGTCCGSCLEPA
ncbi:MAG: Dabb family protein [Pseudomonadota bacterium]